MVLSTAITKLFGIRAPIIQGGMHYVGYAPLSAAVANAGGLGLITALTQPTPEKLREEIQKAKSLLKPNCPGKVGVNLTILPMLSKVPFEDYVNVIIDEKIEIVETAGRPPAEYITMFKKHDIKIIHKCISTRHAISAVKMGADAISLDGFECAGHPGEEDTGNYILQAMGARELNVPFVTSGGVGNGRQLAASLALGASGVNMGTRFMATVEAPIHDSIKQALVNGSNNDTTLVMRSLRNTERVFKNKTVTEVQKIEAEHPGKIEKIIHLVKGDNYRKSFQETGDTESSVWSCGPVMALIDDVPTCDKLINDMVSDAEKIIRDLQSVVVEQ
ncbi:hypothetical protein SARC_01630 [Sphaeroforma arctica JP610]|uniref:Nitronate monooxygenase domain-containing protein n=1 Tax=Sphaeroforma arctica JP610 TaxID=667725 RepID=A0A0L0GB44_9EUKA|nr:hypothetical protein SARC_01630 [Sphaeroforma arctica JP610]KNC86220.1 hypothetical protein SARC_01630 [Sphaeroforma arctica JP610]|eukprot:XP_014160122.1 hypothetical protein SARC_01630 [Sphaeroforma arctica JP610]